MEKADFDPAETIAGFPLLSIKRALGWVGIMEDRDDIALVADALSCPRKQAERVLSAAEQRGLVTPTQAKNQWKTTPLGWQLAMRWKPPPRIEPAIALEGEGDSKAINEMFDDVPCSILRTTPEDDDAFEEGLLEVGVFVDYASPRVIEISVAVPDDYDAPLESTTVESSVYIGVDDAKRFAKALQTAIGRAESASPGGRSWSQGKRGECLSAGHPLRASTGRKGEPSLLKRGVPAAKSPAAVARAAAKAEAARDAAKRKEERAAESTRKAEQRALEATLKELTGRGKRR